MGPKDLAEKIFPQKTRSPDCIRQKKLQLKNAPNRKRLDLDEVFKGKHEEFFAAVENNRGKRGGNTSRDGKMPVCWTSVAAEVDIPHVTAKICQD